MVSELIRLAERRLVGRAGLPARAADPASTFAWENVSAEVVKLFADRIPRDEKHFFMRMAIAEARRSSVRPTVGAVIVRDGEVLSSAFRDFEVVDGTTVPPRRRAWHAEETALKAASGSLAGATLYTTLEPCFRRSMPPCAPGIEPCAVCIARSGIRTVVIGLIDQDPRTLGKGARHLAEHGVRLEHAYRGLELELYELLGDGRFRHSRPRRHGLRTLLKAFGGYVKPLVGLPASWPLSRAQDAASTTHEEPSEPR